jgi:hypothetical protein
MAKPILGPEETQSPKVIKSLKKTKGRGQDGNGGRNVKMVVETRDEG